jgi:hypothetical protein
MMRIAPFVKDTITGRCFRVTPTPHNEVHPMTFSEAAADLDRLVKSRRREQSLREMSDSKDYMEANADDFDRRAEGPRRKDIRATNKEWAGIQALDEDDYLALADDEIDEKREMLVSGRPSRIRFPGAKGDSEIRPFDREAYTRDADIDEDFPAGNDRIRERNGQIRAALGGDAMSWRAQAKRDGVGDDRYASGKSMRRDLDPRCFVKGSRQYDMLKSRVQDAISDERIDPELGMILDSYDPRLLSARHNIIRCISNIPADVRRRYGIPSAPPAMESAFRGMRGSAQGMGCGLNY